MPPTQKHKCHCQAALHPRHEGHTAGMLSAQAALQKQRVLCALAEAKLTAAVSIRFWAVVPVTYDRPLHAAFMSQRSTLLAADYASNASDLTVAFLSFTPIYGPQDTRNEFTPEMLVVFCLVLRRH